MTVQHRRGHRGYMKNISIGNRAVGDGEPVFIIAEAGLNHDGHFEQARELIRQAASARADAIKFQIFKAEELCSRTSELYHTFKSLELNENEWIKLAECAEKLNITFSASVFGEDSANLLEVIGSSFYKIASGDITYLPLLRHVATKKKPILLSTGMATLCEVAEAISEIVKTSNHQVALLHCVSDYPARDEDVNLLTIDTLKLLFNAPVGFSDHTRGTLMAPTAVAVGANIIEKHLTLDKTLPGPDHSLSLEPHEFKQMVASIRSIEQALGDGVKRLTTKEEATKKIARRRVVANVNLHKGTIITSEKLKMVRSDEGIDPKFVNSIIGKTVKRDVREDEPINWDQL
jgi:N,N'-diacetyllegionaminate synthase